MPHLGRLGCLSVVLPLSPPRRPMCPSNTSPPRSSQSPPVVGALTPGPCRPIRPRSGPCWAARPTTLACSQQMPSEACRADFARMWFGTATSTSSRCGTPSGRPSRRTPPSLQSRRPCSCAPRTPQRRKGPVQATEERQALLEVRSACPRAGFAPSRCAQGGRSAPCVGAGEGAGP